MGSEVLGRFESKWPKDISDAVEMKEDGVDSGALCRFWQCWL